MTYLEAKKLHNGDEVIQKQHGYVLTVLDTYKLKPIGKSPLIIVECVTENNSYIELNHKEIK